MDRAIIQDHLAQAERHVSQGERHLSRQREIIADLERDGHDSSVAQALSRTNGLLRRARVARVAA
jgi:hypothetical protein